MEENNKLSRELYYGPYKFQVFAIYEKQIPYYHGNENSKDNISDEMRKFRIAMRPLKSTFIFLFDQEEKIGFKIIDKLHDYSTSAVRLWP